MDTTTISPATNQNLTEALLKLQQNLPRVSKDAKAAYGKYATLGNVLDVVRPVLNDHGFVIIQSTDGESLITELRHTSGGSLLSRMPLVMGPNKSAQALGSAISYARRYSILIMLGIAPDDDDDGASTVMKNTIANQTRKVS